MQWRQSGLFRNLHFKGAGLGLLAIVTMAVLAACSADPTATPTATPTAEDHAALGARLYLQKGCATCHGRNAEGTSAAPALPGHTEDQVIRQVRNPVGRMPAFSEAQISDDELEQIADFIVSLGSGDGHDHMEPMDMGHDSMMEMHHWMARDAIQADNIAEADHHIDHITELTNDAEHLHLMDEIAEAVHAGNKHDAEHMLEELLANRVQPSLDLSQLHARIAMGSLAVGNVADARHHLQHIVELGRQDDLMAMAESAMRSLDAGDMAAAEHEIREMMAADADHMH